MWTSTAQLLSLALILSLAGHAVAQECPEPPPPAPTAPTADATVAAPILLAQGGYVAPKPYDFNGPSGSPTDSLRLGAPSRDLTPRSGERLGPTQQDLGTPPPKKYGSPRGSSRDN